MPRLDLNFSDSEMARLLSESKPPDGVRVSKPQMLIQCSAPAEIFAHVSIDFAIQVSSLVIGTWILAALRKSSKKSTRINRRKVPLQKREIVRLISRELANERRREAQWRQVHVKKT